MTTDRSGILARLERPGAIASELLSQFQVAEYATVWRTDPALYRAFTRALIRQGHPTRAFELAREGLAVHPGEPVLQYLSALALARGGNVVGAETCVAAVLAAPALEPALHADAMALRGRLYKDRCERAGRSERRKDYAARAAACYLRAADLSGSDTYHLINAATMSLLAGDVPRSQGLARRALELGQLDGKSIEQVDDYWHLATMGQAHFLLGDLTEAASWYARAVSAARARQAIGDIASMRRDAHLIREELKVSDELLRLFHVGGVVVFAGHMIDHPDRATRDGLPRRFPADAELVRKVGEAIRAELDKLNVTIGVCSAACGSDILFAEQVLARGAELHVVLPYARNDFYATSVDFGRSEKEWRQWRSRCDAILERATEVHHATTERHLGDDVLTGFNNEFMQGLAVLRAAQRGVVPRALTVYDPSAHNPVGGTGHFFELWTRRGLPSSTINLGELREQTLGPAAQAEVPTAPPAPASDVGHGRELKSMLFADVKNFSSLMDPLLPKFFLRFLGGVSAVLRALPAPPMASNTWGDGLYLVFDRPSEVCRSGSQVARVERADGVGRTRARQRIAAPDRDAHRSRFSPDRSDHRARDVLRQPGDAGGPDRTGHAPGLRVRE